VAAAQTSPPLNTKLMDGKGMTLETIATLGDDPAVRLPALAA
jgi:hypothetical protein